MNRFNDIWRYVNATSGVNTSRVILPMFLNIIFGILSLIGLGAIAYCFLSVVISDIMSML